MRVLLKASLNTEKANELIRTGKLPQLMQETMENIKPEAAYFTLDHGVRTCYMVFDMQDSSEMPPKGEPFLMDLDAELTMTPVMNAEDLQKGLSQLR
ncbi:hypothetical protein OG866_20270 [Streptomyces sp. NBC_00663]|uniref:hypothetical protein n=1 Tax=Streptomyces sp. NBC_00663 TaxID=2975801 RepID=UPI002E31B9EC|nr:hypothetical protein [Streptomyces sp. NBC_00663]